MKIAYVHVSDPKTEKIHNTERSLKGSIGFIHGIGGKEPTQEEWDQFTLEKFEADAKKGQVLSYSVIV